MHHNDTDQRQYLTCVWQTVRIGMCALGNSHVYTYIKWINNVVNFVPPVLIMNIALSVQTISRVTRLHEMYVFQVKSFVTQLIRLVESVLRYDQSACLLYWMRYMVLQWLIHSRTRQDGGDDRQVNLLYTTHTIVNFLIPLIGDGEKIFASAHLFDSIREDIVDINSTCTVFWAFNCTYITHTCHTESITKFGLFWIYYNI